MPAGAVELISFRADMSDLRQQLAQLPGLSDKEAKAMVQSLERQMKRAEQAAKAAAAKSKSAFDRMGDAAKSTGRDLRKFGAAAGELAPGLGSALGAASSFVKLLGAMANPATLATAAVVSLGAAGVGAVVGMVKVTQASEQLLTKLQPFQQIDGILPELDPSVINSIHRANDAMAGLRTVFDAFTLTLGAEFAPYVERGSELLLRLGLMALDAFQKFAAGKDLLREFAVFLTTEFIQGLAGPIDTLVDLIGLMGRAAKAVGLDGVGDKLLAVQDGWEGLTRSIAEGMVDRAFGVAAEGVEWLDQATAEYAGTAEQLIATQGALKRATTETRDVNAELAEIITGLKAEQLTAEQKVIAAYEAEVAKINELEAAGANAHAAQTARNMAAYAAAQQVMEIQQKAFEETDKGFASVQREAEQKIKELDAYLLQQTEAFKSAVLGTSQATLGAISDITSIVADKVAAAGGKGAKQLYAISKAAAIAQATISTYEAAAKALTLGPVAGPIAMAGVIATGLAQVAKIAATPPPKTQAHMGQIAPSSPLAPDEFVTPGNVRALRSETILDSAATSRLGGPAAINAAVNGGGPSRPILIGDRYKHFDNRVEDLLLTDSRTARQLAAETRSSSRSY